MRNQIVTSALRYNAVVAVLSSTRGMVWSQKAIYNVAKVQEVSTAEHQVKSIIEALLKSQAVRKIKGYRDPNYSNIHIGYEWTGDTFASDNETKAAIASDIANVAIEPVESAVVEDFDKPDVKITSSQVIITTKKIKITLDF